ncbi:hypothetical protein AKO1_002185 [Acrasis kona]|uniref:Uncharacterized protein n=1 Tax=Acrasis kona TaxID=1008807 RepID=A0AAW2Z9I1_9EUKA
MTEYTTSMTQLLEHMNKVYEEENPSTTMKQVSRANDIQLNYGTNYQMEGNSYSGHQLPNVLSDTSYTNSLECQPNHNYVDQASMNSISSEECLHNLASSLNSDFDLFLDNKCFEDEDLITNDHINKRSRIEYEINHATGSDEFIDATSIDLDCLFPAKKQKTDYNNQQYTQLQHPHYEQQQTIPTVQVQQYEQHYTTNEDTELVSRVLELYHQMKIQKSGGLQESLNVKFQPSNQELQEFAQFLHNSTLEDLHTQLDMNFGLVPAPTSNPPILQPAPIKRMKSPNRTFSPTIEVNTNHFRYLVCNGPMKRKNKRKEPEDQFTMKWKLCN